MKKNLLIFLSIIALFLQSCYEEPSITADHIIDKAITAHGSNLLEQSVMEFNFRGVEYKSMRDNGIYEFTRSDSTDSTTVVDLLANQTKLRTINGVHQQVVDSLMNSYASSLNSVIYFAQLPYSLDGAAVYREFLGEKTIKNQSYYKVKITFDPKGGGEDYEDEFIYWIHQDNFLIDYLAYSYCEEDCGYRFRESVNRRKKNGIIVQDYNNYKELIQDPNLSHMDQLFIDGKLELLSEINIDDVVITLKNG
ncbi:DUF6503 family protein [Nonlabens ulvanivorans]|uniref:DUF6503 family protein n=1 Tax=Nonlabens ulvanivorans TaxID=906888 RepID=UPI0037C93133